MDGTPFSDHLARPLKHAGHRDVVHDPHGVFVQIALWSGYSHNSEHIFVEASSDSFEIGADVFGPGERSRF